MTASAVVATRNPSWLPGTLATTSNPRVSVALPHDPSAFWFATRYATPLRIASAILGSRAGWVVGWDAGDVDGGDATTCDARVEGTGAAGASTAAAVACGFAVATALAREPAGGPSARRRIGRRPAVSSGTRGRATPALRNHLPAHPQSSSREDAKPQAAESGRRKTRLISSPRAAPGRPR
jgi:hypothetical protein